MGIHEEVRRLVNTESAKHKRLIEYVVRQLHSGRDLQPVLEDPYVVNRITLVERRALLEEPEVVGAAGGEVLKRMRTQLETAAAAAGPA